MAKGSGSRPKKKTLKVLRINPLEHDIELRVVDDVNDDEAFPMVKIKFGDLKGEAFFTSGEAMQISKWFLRLAEAIK